ncbi:MAG: hypothetical protein QNJ97_25060 [Myxococcota bacterium]|nr:hypothetical protein [Myxococcota bacterium]
MAEKNIKVDEQKVLDTVIERILTQDIEMIVAPVIQGLVYRGDDVSANSVLEMLDGSTQGVMLKASMDKLGKFKRATTKI